MLWWPITEQDFIDQKYKYNYCIVHVNVIERCYHVCEGCIMFVQYVLELQSIRNILAPFKFDDETTIKASIRRYKYGSFCSKLSVW